MREYCRPVHGIQLLNKNTNASWRTIPPALFHFDESIVTILPYKPGYYNLCPIIAQPGYLPIQAAGYCSPANTPTRLLQYLQTAGKQALLIMPSVKYDLDGIKLTMAESIQRLEGIWVVEGVVSLNGDIIVKPSNGLNITSLSANNGTGRVTLINSEQARKDFISSLKIGSFLGTGKPSLTIGSSLTDKILMTSTSIQLNPENANSFKITAVFTPHYQEIQSRYGLTLEIQMGYEFSGKATLYPSLPTPSKSISVTHGSISKTEIISGVVIGGGVIIFCVFAAPACMAISTGIAGSLLLADN